jgi:hypothetical protein
VPSPWVQRAQRASQSTHAAAERDSTLGDRVSADKRIVITRDSTPDYDPITGEAWDATGNVSDWTGTSDYWHLVRRGLR